MKFSISLSLVLCATAAGLASNTARAEKQKADEGQPPVKAFEIYVDDAGNISRPDDYRRSWSHLGSWFVREDEQASGPGVHDVYANPAAVDGYRKTGKWPDGSVLVKEVNGIEEGAKTTGHARWAGDTGVWFVMIRDRKNRFPENQAWAEGWGWALFDTSSPQTSLTKTWKGKGFNNCYGCHVPVKDSDWVYIEGYPTVRSQEGDAQ